MTTRRRGGAVVTGAGSGIGRGIARMLAERGHPVLVTDLDGDEAAKTAAEIDGATAMAVDVREESQVLAARDAVLGSGSGLEVWVNNAGVLHSGPAWEQSTELRRLMFEVNAVGTVNGTVAAIEGMRELGGHIVNVVSLAGLAPIPGESVYAATKHAAVGFSLSTMADLRLAGLRGIDISCVCSDGVWTPMLHDKVGDPAAAMSFSGVLLEPDQVVDAVARVLDRPRLIATLPAWRGVQARLAAAFPAAALRLAPVLVAQGRRTQRDLAAVPSHVSIDC